MVETVIEAIRINVVTEQHVVILKEVDGSRVIPIWIGQDVAQAIALELQGADVKRPQTHDLLRNVISEMGGAVDRIIVNDLRDSTFFALIEITAASKSVLVDSRPSDAIALAVRTRSPIYVEDHVIEQAGIVIPAEVVEEPERPEQGPPDPVENERLNVFRDFVNSLDLDEPKSEKE
ncbi:MAG: bifunctional nuclease family protein [Chloroflexota bacterium]|nr:bifunctional nuclease family protein [Chloroflexota bacterium]